MLSCTLKHLHQLRHEPTSALRRRKFPKYWVKPGKNLKKTRVNSRSEMKHEDSRTWTIPTVRTLSKSTIGGYNPTMNLKNRRKVQVQRSIPRNGSSKFCDKTRKTITTSQFQHSENSTKPGSSVEASGAKGAKPRAASDR